MDAFEGNGVFWRADNPELKLAGHFSYDPKIGADLELIGGLLEVSSGPIGPDAEAVTICGAIPGKTLVLLFATDNGLTVGSATTFDRYKSLLVLEGADWEALNRSSFDEVEIELDLLPRWVGEPKFEFAYQPAGSGTPEMTSVTLHPRASESATEWGLKVALETRWSRTWDELERAELNQRFVLTISYALERDIEDILEDVGHVQSLITIGMDSPCGIGRTTAFRNDLTRLIGEDEHPQPIDIYIRPRYVPSAEEADTPRVMMGLEVLGGLLTIVRWIQSARRLRPVVGGLLSIRYSSGVFLENRYDNVIGAAETFHRIVFDNEIRPQHEYDELVAAVVAATDTEHQDWVLAMLRHGNEPRLRHRLREMSELVAPVMTELVGDLDRWTRVVATLRNRLTHHDDTVPFEWEPADALFLGDSVYVLVATGLLVESGVETQVLMSVFSNPRILHLRAVLPEVINRLFAQLDH